MAEVEIQDASNFSELPSTDDSATLDLLASALRMDLSDVSLFMNVLAVRLEAMFPSNCQIVRRKTGLLSRVKVVERITITLGEDEFVLRLQARAALPVAIHAKRVRSIIIKSEELDFSVWSERLSRALVLEAGRTGKTRDAIAKLLGVS